MPTRLRGRGDSSWQLAASIPGGMDPRVSPLRFDIKPRLSFSACIVINPGYLRCTRRHPLRVALASMELPLMCPLGLTAQLCRLGCVLAKAIFTNSFDDQVLDLGNVNPTANPRLFGTRSIFLVGWPSCQIVLRGSICLLCSLSSDEGTRGMGVCTPIVCRSASPAHTWKLGLVAQRHTITRRRASPLLK